VFIERVGIFLAPPPDSLFLACGRVIIADNDDVAIKGSTTNIAVDC